MMRHSQQNSRSELSGELAFYWSRPILFLQLAVCLFFAVLCGDLIFFHAWLDDSATEGLGRILIRVTWVCSLLGLFGVLREINGRPRLWTDFKGVWYNPNEANVPEYVVPWSAIRDIELRLVETSESTEPWLEMRLDPARWKPPRDRSDSPVDAVPIGHLGGKPHDIVFAVRERWKRSRITQ